MIEKLFLNTEGGVPALLASIVIILALHLLTRVAEFLWGFVKKKSELSEQSINRLATSLEANTKAVEKLDLRIREAEETIAEIPKFKQDLRRLFTAVKHIAGEEWVEIRKSILEDEKL